MKTTRILVLSSILFASPLSSPLAAQTDKADSTTPGQGSWAMQFGVGSNFTLTSFRGATIALQYHCAESGAVRVGVTLNGSVGDQTNLTTQGSMGTPPNTYSTNGSSNSSSIELAAEYLWYLRVRERVHFYVGTGPSVLYAHNADQAETISAGPDGTNWNSTVTSSSENLWNVGAVGVVGVEWFPSSWCSLHAEYGVALRYRWSSNTTNQESSQWPMVFTSANTGAGSTKGWALGSNGTNFSLSVYF